MFRPFSVFEFVVIPYFYVVFRIRIRENERKNRVRSTDLKSNARVNGKTTGTEIGTIQESLIRVIGTSGRRDGTKRVRLGDGMTIIETMGDEMSNDETRVRLTDGTDIAPETNRKRRRRAIDLGNENIRKNQHPETETTGIATNATETSAPVATTSVIGKIPALGMR